MQEIAIAFCKALEEQMTEKIDNQTKEMVRFIKWNERSNIKLEKRVNVLEKRLLKEIQKNNAPVKKRKDCEYRVRIS